MDENFNLWECPHASATDWGSCSCKLYDPYITDDKKKLVKHGTCDSNVDCIFKQFIMLEKRIRELDKLQNEVQV